MNRESMFARLNAIKACKINLTDIGSKEDEIVLLGITRKRFERWGKEWVEFNYPDIPKTARLKKLSEFYGRGAKKKALFQFLERIKNERSPNEKIENKRRLANKFSISDETFNGWYNEWVEGLKETNECIKIDLRKIDLFSRLDKIHQNKIPMKEVGNRFQESVRLGINDLMYEKWGIDWVRKKINKPNLKNKEAIEILNLYSGLGARKRSLFIRLDKIKGNQISEREIGNQFIEAKKVDLSIEEYNLFGKEWVASNYPQVPIEKRQEILSEFYGRGEKRRAVFSRLDKICNNQVPIAQIGTKVEEASKLGLHPNKFLRDGLKWVASRFPEIPKNKHLAKLREQYGKGVQRRMLFARLEAIDNGFIPIEEIGTESQEADWLNISVASYLKWGKEWLCFKHPEIAPKDQMAILQSYYGIGQKKLLIKNFVRHLLDTPIEQSLPRSIKKLAYEFQIHIEVLRKTIREEIENYFTGRRIPVGKVQQRTNELYNKIFPHDLWASLGKLNHIILENGFLEIYKNAMEKKGVWGKRCPKISSEKKEGTIQHDILIENIHTDDWFISTLKRNLVDTHSISQVFNINLTEALKYNRISIDFTMWGDPEKIDEKVKKYTNKKDFGKRTLLIIGYTTLNIKDIDKVELWRNHSDVRITSAENIFRFLGVSPDILQKVRDCCQLTRKGNYEKLRIWAKNANEGKTFLDLQQQKKLDDWNLKQNNQKEDHISSENEAVVNRNQSEMVEINENDDEEDFNEFEEEDFEADMEELEDFKSEDKYESEIEQTHDDIDGMNEKLDELGEIDGDEDDQDDYENEFI